MLRETDLLRVKLVAHTFLDVQIQETALSPVIVSHPFTNSGISALRNEDGSLSMVDLINNSDDCTRWRRKVGEQIDSAENVHQIFVLLNPPYYLTFIKFAASALSEKDLGQLLSTAWTQEECPNQDCNVPFPVSWTVKMKKKQKETQDILSYHTQAAGCSDKARAKASGGRQPIEECGRTGL